MTLGQLLVLYLMAGCGVAVAVYVSSTDTARSSRGFQFATALFFWPLYLPLLLTPRAPVGGESNTDLKSGNIGNESPASAAPPADEMAQAILQVDAELEGALLSLDGWAENALAREKGRLCELRSAWSSQAQRIREMERLLGKPEDSAMEVGACPEAVSQRLRASQEVITQNKERLRQVRDRSFADLMGMLAWVRELVSMIHLAKFTGAPAARAEELVAQIAAAVEGLSALTWQEADSSPPHAQPLSPTGARGEFSSRTDCQSVLRAS
ncbi:MAG: hypothetical protein L0Y72_02945 [Gemmataceae bacterium]|nr:hypothetical protein [Gemmataceae bacterium]MCI0737974.1 hypothetical protein [Gemmataceae bacterium]